MQTIFTTPPFSWTSKRHCTCAQSLHCLQYTWWKNALQCLPSNTSNYCKGNNTSLGFPAFISHNSINFPVSCFSAPYIHGLSLRNPENFRMKPFLTTLFLGHEGTFHSNNNVRPYSPPGWLPDYRLSFHKFQTLSFITFHITYLCLFSLPSLTCIQTYMHTKKTPRYWGTDITTPRKKDKKTKRLKMFNGRIFGKKLLLRYKA